MKCDDTPVTAADRRAEEHLRQRIMAAFPEDGIVGEELAARPGTSGFRWILDPIDGTKSFIHGVPLYATLVAVECEGQSVLGVIRIPALTNASMPPADSAPGISTPTSHRAAPTSLNGSRWPRRCS